MSHQPNALEVKRGEQIKFVITNAGRLAFANKHYGVGTRDNPNAAQWLAYAIHCRRFTPSLATRDARLGADAGRYSFTVSDFHRLLLVGLPAHSV